MRRQLEELPSCPLHREEPNRNCEQGSKLEERQHCVWRLFAQQKFRPGSRRCVEVGYGAQFLFPHHGERREHGIQMRSTMMSPGTIANRLLKSWL